MRIFQILLAATVLGLGCILALFSKQAIILLGSSALTRCAVNLLALSALLLLLHLVVEGARWQMLPLYVAVAVLIGAAFLSVTGGQPIAAFVALFGIVCVATSCFFTWMLPLFRFAPATGPHQTGTSIHCLIDSSRIDISPTGHRELMIQLWYPAGKSPRPLAPYRRKEETTRISSYQAVLKTSSRLEAPLARSDKAYPVLLFNPAWNGRRTQNTFLVEELASHGFVVAAIDHTHNSEPVAFTGGRVVMAQHEPAMEDVSTSTVDDIQRIGDTEVRRQALDNRFVLNQLALWNQEQGSQWYQQLDTERAGAFGHSLGGATSVETWATDPRVKAALNMDGWTFGEQAATGKRSDTVIIKLTERSLLFMYEGNYEQFADAARAQASGKSSVELEMDDRDATRVRTLLENYGGYCLQLRGADHANFTDRPVSSPLRRFAGGGSIHPRLAHRIVRDYAVNFFSQALLGNPSLLLNGDRGYAEVRTFPVSESIAPDKQS